MNCYSIRTEGKVLLFSLGSAKTMLSIFDLNEKLFPSIVVLMAKLCKAWDDTFGFFKYFKTTWTYRFLYQVLIVQFFFLQNKFTSGLVSLIDFWKRHLKSLHLAFLVAGRECIRWSQLKTVALFEVAFAICSVFIIVGLSHVYTALACRSVWLRKRRLSVILGKSIYTTSWPSTDTAIYLQ